MPVERLHKIMAQAGIGSRRACEEIIRQQRVKVDGKIAVLGAKVDPHQQNIVVDGRPLARPETPTYVALYKPCGVLSVSQDDRGRRTVRDLVSLPGHLYPVGRLDALSEGLVILTNDGELTNLLTHPRYKHTKEYKACVSGHPKEQTLKKWQRGVFLDGKRTAPAEVSVMRRERDHTWLHITLHEGRKRQIRRVAAMLGHRMRQLIRVRIGPVHLGNLEPGQWRHLDAQELKTLNQSKASVKRAPSKKRRPRRNAQKAKHTTPKKKNTKHTTRKRKT